jgi:pyridoxamine 5'-phosphate oxidase
MTVDRLTVLLSEIIDDAKTAVLATVDENNSPKVRWITPALLVGYPATLFIVSAGHFAKVAQARKNPHASIMLQTRSLDRVLTCEGILSVVENPSIRAELLEMIGNRLHAFWKTGSEERELVTLEFTISKAVFYLPLTGTKELLGPPEAQHEHG